LILLTIIPLIMSRESDVVVHTCNPNTQEAEAGTWKSSKPDWDTW
jgi:hypothetical protein